MKQLFSILFFVCIICSCEKIMQDILQNYDSPTYVEMNGEGYTSKEEHLATIYFPDIYFDDSSFSFRYARTLYKDPESSFATDQMDIYLSASHGVPLVIGKRYALEDMSLFDELKHDGKAYDLTEGWITFHDIDRDGNDVYVSGSFEFKAITEDGKDETELKNGSFNRLQMQFNK